MNTYLGSCHCGTVRFTLKLPRPIERVLECDCSICTKKGIVHHPAQDHELELLAGEPELSMYQFETNTAKHWFCSRCGIHAFGRPRSAPDRYTVNVRCLDDFDAVMGTAEVVRFDGRNHPKDRAP